MVALLALIVFCEAALGTLTQVVLEGNNVTMSCTESLAPYPQWTGPNITGSVTIYNYLNHSTLNPSLGEKSNRLTWDPQNNRSLILQNVLKYDTGMYICYDGNTNISINNVSVIVLPPPPVISEKVSLNDTRIVVRGTEDQPVQLTCTSTGGYPKPYLKWYRGRNQTHSLISDESSNITGDGNYIVVQHYNLTPTRHDDRVSYLCQSSFDLAEPSNLSDQVLLYLNLKPLDPTITVTPVTENVSSKVAECTTSQFRPKTIQVWLQKEGNNVSSEITYTENVTTETYTLTSSYSDSLSRKSNGNSLVCHISHNTVQTPLKGSDTIRVNFKPLTAKLVGATSNIVANGTNTISLNCTSGTSNPRSMIKWFINNTEVNSTGVVKEINGEYNGKMISQILEFVPDRIMDGDVVHCTVHNSVNAHIPVESTQSTIELLYHPIITSLFAVKEIVEGTKTTFTCKVHSKPSANVTWYHDTDVFQTESPTVKDTGELVIHLVKRTHAGTYTCVANNGYMPNWTNETDVVVQYAPDVDVTTRNVTVNDSSAELDCKADGVPSIYTYSDWQHKWPGYGSINHSVELGNNQTLTLTSLTYEYSGEYKCTVSNGVSGSLNPNAGYGKVYLKIETYPIITTPSYKKVSAQLNMTTSTIIHFYSNRNDSKVECYQGESEHDCPYAIHTAIINLPVFDSVIQTEGFAAKITFVIQHTDHFGNITVKISNGIGKASTYITVVPEGPPERPHSIGIEDISPTSVTITWIPGFNGGLDQTFLLQHSTTANTMDQYKNYTIHDGKTRGLLNATLTDLQSGTIHYLRLLAYNEKGNSSFTKVYNFLTAFKVSGTDKTTSDSMAIVTGVAVTSVVVLIASSVVLILVIRYRRKKGGKTEQTRQGLYGDENIYDEDGMEINQAYVSGDSLGIQPSSTTDGASNIYAQVDKSKMQIMHSADTTYAVVDKTKKREDTLLGQTDIYSTPLKKKDKKQTKNNYQKKKERRGNQDKMNKRSGGDVYENIQEFDLYRNNDQKDERTDANLYHNEEESIPYKQNLNKDGLLYADLALDNNSKGQKRLVIRGLENATDYVEVDFSKKAEPLPESDDEACST